MSETAAILEKDGGYARLDLTEVPKGSIVWLRSPRGKV